MPRGFRKIVPLSKVKGPRLCFGFVAKPYPVPRRLRHVTKPRRLRHVTTADVAAWLEDQYGVMRTYLKVHERDIIAAMANSVEGGLESALMGRKVDLYGRGTQKIQAGFRKFISSREAERVGIPGTPTRAALMGYSKRRVRPRARGPRRPSFRDTGLYMNAFRAWVE